VIGTKRTVWTKRTSRGLRLFLIVGILACQIAAFPLRVEFQIEDAQLLGAVSTVFRDVNNELERIFNFSLRVRITVRLGDRASSRLGFVQMGEDEYVVVLSAAEAFHRTLRHELMHVYLDAWARRGGIHVPLWIHEGFANWFESVAGYRTTDLIFSGWPPIDPLKFQNYPKGDRLNSYYVYITDLFLTLDSRIGFRNHLIELLDLVERGNTWKDAFSQMLGEDFAAFYCRWRWKASLLGFLGWAMLWMVWLAGPFVLGVLLIKRGRLKKGCDVSSEELEELEKAFGERYWEKEDE